MNALSHLDNVTDCFKTRPYGKTVTALFQCSHDTTENEAVYLLVWILACDSYLPGVRAAGQLYLMAAHCSVEAGLQQ